MLFRLTFNVNTTYIELRISIACPNLHHHALFATLAGPQCCGLCGDSDGPLAAIGDEPRQARKGATVTIDSGAEI